MSERTPFDAVRSDGHIAQPGAYYATLYPKLREVAYQHGYALAIHGSLNRDLDLVAVPWTDAAVREEVLVVALCDRAYGLITPGENPTMKPHGRHAWTIHLPGAGGYIDLSVMPLADGAQP